MRLRAAIRAEADRNVRCVLWCVLAETARLCSNSRTSTFKIHIRSKGDLENRSVDVLRMFRDLSDRAVADISKHRSRLADRGYLDGNHYKYSIDILHADVRNLPPSGKRKLADLIVTSPPYGDNRSTVPYGQHSWLPASWVDLSDAQAGLANPGNPYDTDTNSLGGRSSRTLEYADGLARRSTAFAAVVDALSDQPRDRFVRVSSFVRDLDESLDPILSNTTASAPMVWVMGDRVVGGHRVPTTSILRELLEGRGATCESTLHRTIAPNRKRMALRNQIADTMRRESILVMRAPAVTFPGRAPRRATEVSR